MTRFVVFPKGPSDTTFMNSIYTSEIRFDTRLSMARKVHKLRILQVHHQFQLSYCPHQFPRIGIPHFFKSDYEYERLQLNIPAMV